MLSAARVLALRAQADEGLALAARGGGDASLADFDATLKRLGVEPGASGLLGEATAAGRDTGHSTTRCSGCATVSRTTDGSTTAW